MKASILRFDNFGRGITYYDDKICFISNAFPNELVDFKIVKETSKYIEGESINIIEKSSDRVESNCLFSKICGGCCFQEYDYSLENKYKEDKIKYLVERHLNLDKNIVKNIVFGRDYYYRNKLILHGNEKKLGLYKYRTNEIINIDKCVISNKKINEIISLLKDVRGIKEVLIRTSNDEKKVIIDIEGHIEGFGNLSNQCDVLLINGKIISKNDSIITNIGSKQYYLSSGSFFQVNEFLTFKIFDKVLEYVKEIKPLNVLDLYCGTGSFGIYIADYVKSVVGVDCNQSNIDDANRNKELNNIDNIEYICDKVENVIDRFKDYDLVIVDPPRAGLDIKSCNHLLDMSPKYIIYVSCDPNTLVRDLKIFSVDYEISEITPYNLFPKTYHCESICILERK